MSYIVQSVPGSVGHPELCRRPCIYFAAGQCRNSADCNFCRSARRARTEPQRVGEKPLGGERNPSWGWDSRISPFFVVIHM